VIQGGGNMPAYGKNLNPAEVDALVSYLMTLRPNYHPGARYSAAPENPASQGSASGNGKGG
jgi:ubiquinol-cytochrome c reductase cytochrome b subunit